MTKMSQLLELAYRLGGLAIIGCLPGSPAALAGVRFGDILLSVDDRPTPTWDDFIRERRNSGAVLKLHIFRSGQEFDLSLNLREQSPRSMAEVLVSVTGFESVPGEGEGEKV